MAGTESFDEFYDRHVRGVTRVLRTMLPRPQDVEDVRQHAFARMWELWCSVQGDVRRRNLLYDIARSTAIDTRRRHENSVTVLQHTFADTALGTSDCPSEAVVRKERVGAVTHAVRRAIDALPPSSRALVVTEDLEYVSLAEVSRAEGSSYAALRQRRSRVLRELREDLRDVRAPFLLPIFRRSTRELWRRMGQVPWFAQLEQAAFVGIMATALAVAPTGSSVASAASPTPPQARHGAPHSPAIGRPRPLSPQGPYGDGRSVGSAVATPSRSEAAPGRRLVPPVKGRCLPDNKPVACLGERGMDGDSLTVHTPIGDAPPVTQGYVPVCDEVPDDQPVAECHTSGDPHYLVSPPPHPAGG